MLAKDYTDWPGLFRPSAGIVGCHDPACKRQKVGIHILWIKSCKFFNKTDEQ